MNKSTDEKNVLFFVIWLCVFLALCTVGACVFLIVTEAGLI